MRETQPKGLEEAQLKEGEMVEDFIPKAPWKGMRGIVRWKNGQTLQVKEEGGLMFITTLLQSTAGIQGPLQPLPHLKIDSSQTGAALDQDPHLWYHHPRVFLWEGP